MQTSQNTQSLLDMGQTPKEVAALLFISARSVQRWGANWRDHMSLYKAISLVIWSIECFFPLLLGRRPILNIVIRRSVSWAARASANRLLLLNGVLLCMRLSIPIVYV